MKCGQVLFESSEVVGHSSTAKGLQTRGSVVACTSLFLLDQPEALLDTYASTTGAESEEVVKTDGKLQCPKCKARVGHLSWSGLQCSCGTWVTPAFQITVSKIDYKLAPTSSSLSTAGEGGVAP